MAQRVLIRGGEVYDGSDAEPARVDLLVDDGRIQAIDDGLPDEGTEMIDAAGLLGRDGGSVVNGDEACTRTVVGIQGASYQAAQYLGKVIMAEHWSRDGTDAGSVRQPIRVSANTAAITRTRSLDHPVFTAAFGGAAAFGVQTFTPRQSRRINGLLALADWLRPEAQEPGRVGVHGGIHTLPYPLEGALRVAAAIGFARSPRLLRGLVSR